MTDPKAALVALQNKYGPAPGKSLPQSAAADSTSQSASLPAPLAKGSQGGGGTYGGKVTGSAEGAKNALAALKEKYTMPSSPAATGDVMAREARKQGATAAKAARPARTRADVSKDIDALNKERQQLSWESMQLGMLDPDDPQFQAKLKQAEAISARANGIAGKLEALEEEDEALRKLEPGYGQNIFQRLWGGIKGGALNALATTTDAARTGAEAFVAGNAGDSYARYAQYAEWARQEYEKEVAKHGADTERARWLRQEWEKAIEKGGHALDDFDHSADNETVQRMANTADRLAAQSQAATEYAKSGATKASKFGVDLVAQGVQMVPDAAANAVAPGSGLALMGVRSFGAGTQKARQAGADLAQQMGYGAASASVEVLTEKMFDGLAGIYGKGFADGVVEGIVDKLAKGRLGPQAVKLISGMSEEAIEELVAGMVDPMLENLYDPQPFFTRYKDPETYAEIGYGMLIGGLMGGIGTGGKLLVNNGINAMTNRASAANITSPSVENETAASGKETTAVNDNPAQHTAVEQRVIEEYKASLDQDLVDFVENARENKGGNSGRYEFKPVSDRAAADIKSLTGVDTTGFKTVMEQRAAEHILKRHGSSGKANQTMNDVNDIGRMQYVIDNYDSMEPGGKATSYTTIKKNGKPGTADTVKYVKAVDGTYYVCEAVPNTKAKTTFIVSAYLENRNADTTHPVLAENSPTSTAETADAYMSANMTIPQPAQKSKRQNQGPNLRQPTLEEYVRQIYGDAGSWARGINMDAWQERMRMFYGEESTAEAEAGQIGLVRDSYVESTMDSGTAERIDQVAKALGLNVRFVDRVAGGMANSSIRGNQVLIEKGNPNPLNFLFGHEITHRMQELAPAQYQRFKELVANEADTRQDARETADNYRQKGLELTDAGAMDEAVSDYAGRMMEDGRLLDDFIRRHSGERTLLETLRDAFRALLEKLRGGERRQAQLAVDRLNRALDTAAANAQNNTATLESGRERYSISTRLGDDLQAVRNGTFQAQKNEVYIGESSNFLTDTIGAEKLTVTMPANKAYSAMVTEAEAKADGRYQQDMNYHGLGAEGLRQALEASEHPLAAFAAVPEKGDKRTNRIVLVTDRQKNGENIAVIQVLGTQGTLRGKNIMANKVITTYDRSALTSDIAQAAVDGRLLHLDKKRSQALLAGRPGSNSLGAIREADFQANIQRFWDAVKWAKNGSQSYTAEGQAENETELGRKLREAMAQAGAQRELALAKSRLQSQYEAALTQARASGNADLANALYKELVRIQKLERGRKAGRTH